MGQSSWHRQQHKKKGEASNSNMAPNRYGTIKTTVPMPLTCISVVASLILPLASAFKSLVAFALKNALREELYI